jgi:DNA-binding response OmpR family regulator
VARSLLEKEERSGLKLRSPSILVVDDDLTFSESLRWLLEANGFAVDVATRSMAAYPIVASGHLDLIIIDLMLPDTDGLELIRWVRDRADFSDLPIMAVSGFDRNYLVAALSAGANEALHKPDDLDRIVETAMKLTGRNGRSDDKAGLYRRAS